MKKIMFICILAVTTFACTISSYSNNKTIKGNKNIVETIINITDYHSIQIAGGGQVVYEQNDSLPPFLSFKIDDNLKEKINITVEGKN